MNTTKRDVDGMVVSIPIEQLNNRISEQLRIMVDNYGLEWVLDTLSAICHERSEEIAVGYTSADSVAKAWARCARVINTAATRESIATASPARL